ncbi:MAG: Ig domain-containing protein, partial [Acidobacteriia bacterium]|nr:Ig domain-containing protein [Terriglobia bacterium]
MNRVNIRVLSPFSTTLLSQDRQSRSFSTSTRAVHINQRIKNPMPMMTRSGLQSSLMILALIILVAVPGVAQTLAISTGPDMGAVALGPAEFPLAAAGGIPPYTWTHTAGSMPPGFALRTDNPSWYAPGSSAGVVGVASAAGTYSFTLQVRDSAGSPATASQTFTLKVSPMTFADSFLADAYVGASYSASLAVNGAPDAVTWGVLSPTDLPPGLSLDASGNITGSPTQEGSYTFSASAASGGLTVWHRYAINVSLLRFTTSFRLPTATQNTAYSANITAAGGTGTLRFTGAGLPPGLGMDASGHITGTPTSGNGVWRFWVQVWDANDKSYNRMFSLPVTGVPAGLPWLENNGPLDDATLGGDVTYVFTANGGTAPYMWSVAGAPAGLVLRTNGELGNNTSPDGCELRGMPTTAGPYSVTITFTDSSTPPVTVSRTFPMNVVALTHDWLPNGTRGAAYSGRLRIIGGAGPYGVALSSGLLPQGLSLNPGTGEVSGTPVENGNFGPRFTFSSGTATLTRTVGFSIGNPSPGNLQIPDNQLLPYASLNQGYSYQFQHWGPSCTFSQTGGDFPAGFSLSPGGVLAGSPMSQGDSIFGVQCTENGNPANYAVRYFRLIVTHIRADCPTNLAFGNVGMFYTANLCVADTTGALSWRITPDSVIPAGLSLDLASGVLSGTPSSAGLFNFGVQVTDSNNGLRLWVTLPIYPAGQFPPVAVNGGPDLGTWPVGIVNYGLYANGGTPPYTLTLTGASLPPGIALRTDMPPGSNPGANAALLGVLTAAGGPYAFTLTATDSHGSSASQAFTVRAGGFKQTSPYNLPDGFSGISYSQTFGVTGQTGTVSWAIAPGNSLPPGLGLSSGGVLSGASAAGVYDFSLIATDSATGVGAWAGYHLNVFPFQITSTPTVLTAVQNQPFSATIAAAGGTPPYTFNGWPPAGLALSSSGVLSGTPNGPGTWDFAVNATDSAGRFYSRNLSLNVVGVPAILAALNPQTDPLEATFGSSYQTSFSVNGGKAPYTWSITSAPAGLILRPGGNSTGAGPSGVDLVGVLLALGPQSFTINVTDSSNPPVTVARTYTLNVSKLWFCWPPLPGGTRGQAYAGTLNAWGGVRPYTFAIQSGSLPDGLTLNPATGQVSGAPTENGNFNLTVLVTDSATPANVFRAGFGLYIASGAPSGDPQVTLSSNGQLSGIPTLAGAYTFRLRFTDTATGSYGIRQYTLNVSPLRITSNATLPWGNANGANGGYATTLTAAGGTGPYYWTVAPGSSLPAGVTLSYYSGVISGTPAFAGTYTFQVQVSDSAGHTFIFCPSVSFYPPNQGPPVAMTIGPDLGVFSVGPVNYDLWATSGQPPYTWSVVGSLPPGLAIRTDRPQGSNPGASASILGVATTPGAYTFSLQVRDQLGSSDVRTLTMRVTGLTVLDSQIPEAFLNQSYAFHLNAAGATGPVTWSLAPGQLLPPGLSLATSGDLTGVPSAFGHYNFTVMAADSTGSMQRGYGMDVFQVRFTNNPLLPNATQNAAYSAILAATGGAAPYTFGLQNNLPPGLSLNPATGAISGAVNAGPGTWRFWAIVTDAGGKSYSRNFAINIIGAPPVLPALNPVNNPGDATLGASGYSFPLSVDGGRAPYSWSIAGTPPGMILRRGSSLPSNWAPTDALLTGTPTAAGNWTFTVSATDSSTPAVTVSRTYTLKVVALWWLTPASCVRGQSCSTALNVYGGATPYAFALQPGSYLPDPMTLGSTGSIAGVPGENGFFYPQIALSDSSGKSMTASPNLFVASGTTPDLYIANDAVLWNTCVNCGYNFQFNWFANGMISGVTFSVEPGSTLPPGLSLSTGGNLSGTATLAGQYVFKIRVTDAGDAANYGVRQHRLNVSPISVTTNWQLPWANVGPYSLALGAIGGSGSYTWSVAPGSALPPGMTLSAGGVFSGMLTSAGAFNFQLKVTDSNGNYFIWGPTFSVYPAGQAPPVAINMGPDLGQVSIGPSYFTLVSSGGS